MKTAVEMRPFCLFQCFILTEALECPLMCQKCPMVALYCPLKHCYPNLALMFFPVDICGPRKTNLGPIEVATTFSHQT